jgi:hypothetical protein
MVPFTICIEEVDDDKAATGRELHKAYEWPLVPRTGDVVGVGGNLYETYQVIHDFDRRPHTIQVILRWPESDFKMLGRNTEWRRIFWDD